MSVLKNIFPDSWRVLEGEFHQPYMAELAGFLQKEWQEKVIFPSGLGSTCGMRRGKST